MLFYLMEKISFALIKNYAIKYLRRDDSLIFYEAWLTIEKFKDSFKDISFK